MKNKKPKSFLIYKLVGFCLLAVSITLLVLSFIVESEWKGHAPHPAFMIPGVFLLVLAIGLIISGFTPDTSLAFSAQKISTLRLSFLLICNF